MYVYIDVYNIICTTSDIKISIEKYNLLVKFFDLLAHFSIFHKYT